MQSDIDERLERARKRYREERDVRVRSEGQDQYVAASGQFASFAEVDPYASTLDERALLHDVINVAIVGGGFGGLIAASKLLEAGIEDFRILEAGSDFGGTWYWNRYPGAQCDVESYSYLPLLEETGYIPKERYSHAPEIFEHARRIGAHFNLYEKAFFQTRVQSLSWNERDRLWRVRTDRGDDFHARFVISALGIANTPKLPGIPGLDQFEGEFFHTARWNYEYTGGDGKGNLTQLSDKTVALIGTGATAIQIVPFLGQHAKELYVFQRTPSSVDLRRNHPTDFKWIRSLAPGWQKRRQDNLDRILSGLHVDEDLIQDGWTVLYNKLSALIQASGPQADLDYLTELADLERMEDLRARVDEIVSDPETAERLKAWYRFACKRPTFSDDYLPTFNRPNVHLIDTSRYRGVEQITRRGLIAGGIEYAVDCIVFATGFEFNTTLERRIGFPITGRGGVSLFDHWRNGLRTLHGHSTHGFPNWFFLGHSQNAITANYIGNVAEQAQHVAYIISQANARGIASVEVTPEAEDAWNGEILEHAKINRAFLESCTPGYYNHEGDKQSSGLLGSAYGGGVDAFNAILRNWRDAGDFPGMEVWSKGTAADSEPDEGGYAVAPGLTLSGNGSWNDLKLDSDVVSGGVLLFNKGDRPSYSAEWTAGGSISYEFDVSDDMRIVTTAATSYQSKLSLRRLNSAGTGPYVASGDDILTVRASASLKSDNGWTLTIFGENLANEQDVIVRPPTEGVLPELRARPRPRTVGLQFEIGF